MIFFEKHLEKNVDLKKEIIIKTKNEEQNMNKSETKMTNKSETKVKNKYKKNRIKIQKISHYQKKKKIQENSLCALTIFLDKYFRTYERLKTIDIFSILDIAILFFF